MGKMLDKFVASVLAGSMLFAAGSVFAAAADDQAAARREARVARQQARHLAILEKQSAKASAATGDRAVAIREAKVARQQARHQAKLERKAAKAEKEQKLVADTELYAEIIGYEQGNIYLLQEGNGKTIRADLGNNGGRLWRLTSMKFSGTFVQDANGRLFKMVRVDYKDPSEGDELRTRGSMGARNINREADPALYHSGRVPTDNSSYITQNLAGVTDLSEYREMDVMEMNQAPAGTKAFLVGRPVETVSQNKVMTFWDRDNNPFYVLMNGGFIPLGQRSVLYGTVRRGSDNVTYLSLERVDSIQ